MCKEKVEGSGIQERGREREVVKSVIYLNVSLTVVLNVLSNFYRSFSVNEI